MSKRDGEVVPTQAPTSPRGEQHVSVGGMRRAYDVLRMETGLPDLSASWVQVFLLVAEHPGETLAWIERECGMRTSTAHRVVVALGGATRTGKAGLGLIEGIPDPRHATRKLYFLTSRGRTIVTAMLSALSGESTRTYVALTSDEFLKQFERQQAEQTARVDVDAIGPQEISNAKRSLAREKIFVGPHIVAFALNPAASIIDEIRQWTIELGGKLYIVPTVAKPNGVAIAEFESAEDQVHFHLRWRGPDYPPVA